MTLYLVTGPPASGKTTYVARHAKPGDITIDYDALANALTPTTGPTHKHTRHVMAVTKAARQAAIDAAIEHTGEHDVYVIHAMPSQRTIDHYRALGAELITIDPGQAIVMARCKAERPWQMQQAAKQWYAERAASKHPRPASKHDRGVMEW
ncbi:terminase small subunit [Mycobacterium phage ThulaThula]|uniref:Polynucleotide kinase n=1 Tax=Mycobacterium phage ThulaThula TaxID=2599880 RepID=A0A5J6TEC2_9CAUD|nr:terminase small subunit [Mycobacterium phage ThulaThula]QFG09106.1 polynucleotide kinase [Mycobacterium phage ThulaThula]